MATTVSKPRNLVSSKVNQVYIPMGLHPFAHYFLIIWYFKLLKKTKDSWPKTSDQVVPGPPAAVAQCNNWPFPIFVLVRSLSWHLYRKYLAIKSKNQFL